MGLMSVSGDNQDWKTCVQVYNSAGFSMEFAAARSASIAYFQIAVWCGAPSHHQKPGRGSLRTTTKGLIPLEFPRDQAFFLSVLFLVWHCNLEDGRASVVV